MAINFPTSLDSLTNPSASDALDSVSVPHATQHSDLNDAVEALEAKVGVDGSAVVSSLDYRVGAVEASIAAGQWDTAQTTETKTASYTLLTADAGKLILVNSSSNLDVTVDSSLDLSIGQRIDLARLGTGTVTVVASGATVNGTPGLKLRARYSTATVLCVGTDDYLLIGDLSA